MFMMMQYIYYGALQRRKEKILQLQVHRRHHLRRHHHQHGSSRGQNTSNSSYERLVGHDGIASGSRKDPVVHQRQAQQQQQQQGTRNWLQSTAVSSAVGMDSLSICVRTVALAHAHKMLAVALVCGSACPSWLPAH